MIKSITIFYFSFFLFSSISFAGEIKGKIKKGNHDLSNTVVYLEPEKKIKLPVPVEPAVMDQVNLNFVPHVLPVLVGTKVTFPNSDKIRHSVFSLNKTKKFDFGTYPPGAEKSIICDQPGLVTVLCYIHHDMSAFIVVLETPYFTLTNDKGEYVIENVPEGKYKLSFWNEENEMKSEDIVIPAEGTVTKNIY